MSYIKFDSDTWEELMEKLKKEEWDSLPIVFASHKPNGKITIDALGLRDISLEEKTK